MQKNKQQQCSVMKNKIKNKLRKRGSPVSKNYNNMVIIEEMSQIYNIRGIYLLKIQMKMDNNYKIESQTK